MGTILAAIIVFAVGPLIGALESYTNTKAVMDHCNCDRCNAPGVPDTQFIRITLLFVQPRYDGESGYRHFALDTSC